MKLLFTLALCLSTFCFAEEKKADSSTKATVTREDTDGVLEADEYRKISSNGGITRRDCPYTCEMRGIPKEHCKEWNSLNGRYCYVQDTRLPSEAIK